MNNLKKVSEILSRSETILLSTHREPDGDGIGSQIALYYALKKINKKVRILNLDKSPDKYQFLKGDKITEIFNLKKIPPVDCALILDTNDKRLISPLYEELELSAKTIIFLDHHPILKEGPKPTEQSLINTKAASTGELAYNLIQELNIELDANIAEALYTSLVFDTHLFRFIRNSSQSHLIAAELLKYSIDAEKIHRELFGDFTKNKIALMAKALNEVEFFEKDQIAFLKIKDKDLKRLKLNKDHTKDLIDLIMNINSIEAAVLVLEISTGEYKLSFRSKGKIEVLKIAETYGGGGHLYAAGASVHSDTDLSTKIKHDSIESLSYSLKTYYGTKT